MNLAEEIRRTQVSQGELMICWLGQAGYLLKDGHGCTLAVDPYLTNCGERIRGFKRLSPMLLPAEDFAPDYYVITHTHFDHLDYDAIPVVKERSPKTQFFGPTSCLDVLAEICECLRGGRCVPVCFRQGEAQTLDCKRLFQQMEESA